MLIKAVKVVFCTDYICVFHCCLSVKGGGCTLFGTAVSKVHCKASGQSDSGMAYTCAIQKFTVFHVTAILVNDVRFFMSGMFEPWLFFIMRLAMVLFF